MLNTNEIVFIENKLFLNLIKILESLSFFANHSIANIKFFRNTMSMILLIDNIIWAIL